MFGDNLFKKVENKTSINKETIMSLAKKLQNSDIKDETTIRSLIKEISTITGKEVTKDKEGKIVETVLKDKIPKNIDKMF